MTVNCLNYVDCYDISVYCGAGGCTVNCGCPVNCGDNNCRWSRFPCDCTPSFIVADYTHTLSYQCTGDCPSPTRIPTKTPTTNPTHNPTHKPTSEPTSNPVIISSKAPTKNPTTPILNSSNPTTSQPTAVSPTTYTHMPSTTYIPNSSMPTTAVPTTNMPTSFMPTTDNIIIIMPTIMPTATPIKHGKVDERYTTDISNEYTSNDKKQSNILIYIILTIG
eukprot:139373_1